MSTVASSNCPSVSGVSKGTTASNPAETSFIKLLRNSQKYHKDRVTLVFVPDP